MLRIDEAINLVNKIITRSEGTENLDECFHLRALAAFMIREITTELNDRPYRRKSDDIAVEDLLNRLI